MIPATGSRAIHRLPTAAALLLAVTACGRMSVHSGSAAAVAPATPAIATETTPGASTPLPTESRVRVKVAGSDDGWLEGTWVETSAGCKGVLITESQLLVRLAALTAMERAITPADGGERWQPAAVLGITDGVGCAGWI